MKRRNVLSLLGGSVIAWPLAARAQTPPKMLRIGVVSLVNQRTATFWVAFDRRMRELGYIEGQNLTIDFVDLNGQVDRYGNATKDVVGRKPDIIIAPGVERALMSAIAATDTLPIVMIAVDYDPFARGYVKSLARPGGYRRILPADRARDEAAAIDERGAARRGGGDRVLGRRIGGSMAGHSKCC
jgi:putative ABC transport system substrate-binding protein